ncbi:LysR family transcriptional regulator [Alsobacter sp. SYSU M60028]|uniref:LysR family transcriptional regulator n=1 Tax=Alsobacter ponti TaxID=2962936 RepID=A0ABT1LFY3_9HYPH|nr:LysR family transcriptional regulator [Alsobacter ponti]MCP8939635.1 LysR family transcriptional regulator [Alsobacter ponti]
MKLRQIEIFRAVMSGGSTTAAAGMLGLSQSAVSRQLTQLEDDLGFELFERSKGRLLPRPEAFALRDEVGDLAAILSRLKRYTEDLKAGTVGQRFLKVAVPHSLIGSVMPEVIADYLATRPDASLELLGGHYDAIEQMVMTRVADLGFVSLPPRDKGFEVRHLLRSESACIMPAGHKLEAREVVRPADLVGQDLILLGRQRPARHAFERLLRRAGVQPRARVEVHSVEATCALVGRGLGVSVVPAFIARLFGRLPVSLRPFDPCVHGEYGIVTLKGAPLSRAAESFAAILKARLTEPPAT